MPTKKETTKKAVAPKKAVKVVKVAKAVKATKATVAPKTPVTKAPVAPKATVAPKTPVTEAPVAPKAKKSAGAGLDIATISKQGIIDTFATKDGDTGSPEVQIALSSQKIANLSSHLQENPKDNHSRRGLLKIIAKRRRILHYLQEKDNTRYTGLIEKLGMKK